MPSIYIPTGNAKVPSIAIVGMNAQGYVDFWSAENISDSGSIQIIVSQGGNGQWKFPASVTDIDFSSTNFNTTSFMGMLAINFSSVNDYDFSACTLKKTSVDGILSCLNTLAQSAAGHLNIAGSNPAPTGGAANASLVALLANGWTIQYNAV